ncbi:MAG: hypothetical protein WAK00_00965 [Microbacterium sp.]|uniref:hypothetical protein n=1 Tax=Microbacterium sp. TaxID=51671 RepID=UPI003BB15943
MIFNYILFLVLFIGGIVLLGIAHELPTMQAPVFVAGILAISLAMASAMHAPSTSTRRDP